MHDLVQRVAGNADPAIMKDDADEGASVGSRLLAGDVEDFVFVFARIPLIQGILGIVDDVHEYLLYLLGIRRYGRQALRQVDLNPHPLLAQLRFREDKGFLENTLHSYGFFFFLVVAGEGEETLDDAGTALSFLGYPLGHVVFSAALDAFVRQDPGVVDDAVYGIIDLVGHAGRQFADRREMRGPQRFNLQGGILCNGGPDLLVHFFIRLLERLFSPPAPSLPAVEPQYR